MAKKISLLIRKNLSILPLVLAGLFSSSPLLAEPYLRIVQPFENYNLPAVKESFVFGSVLPATATLTINGVPVTPHKNGGFLAMIPFEPGRFELTAVAYDGASTTTITRRVNVAEPLTALPSDSRQVYSISPNERVVMREGGTLFLSFRGAPGGSAYFKINGRGPAYPMNETDHPVTGTYEGAYTLQGEDNLDNAYVLFILKTRHGQRLTQRAPGRITMQKRRIPRFIQTTEETVLLTGPGSTFGYHMFFPKGVQLEVIGERGEFYNVELDQSASGWIRKAHARELPAGTPSARSVTRNIRVYTTEGSTILETPLDHVHPFRVEQSINPHRLRLTLFGVVPDTDRIRYKSRNTQVQEIKWVQETPGSAIFDILTEQDFAWGYDVRYEGNTLIVEIRHAPKIRGWGGSLTGLKVAVDAGHTKNNFGTIGPWGHTEAEINLLTALKLKELLEKKGAEVVMIQDGTKEMGLKERTDLAWAEKAHMFISIHCDATGEGRNPREEEGFSVHYYQPQSRPLADEIHSLYREKSGIRDQGLWQSNLAVARATTMPSILLEQAFLILPEFEELLLTPKFQKTSASIVVESIEKFLKRAGL